MKFKLEPEDFTEGTPRDSCNCVFARALKRNYFSSVDVIPRWSYSSLAIIGVEKSKVDFHNYSIRGNFHAGTLAYAFDREMMFPLDLYEKYKNVEWEIYEVTPSI